MISILHTANYPSDTWATWKERMACFSGDGKNVIVGSEDGTIQYFDLTGAEVSILNATGANMHQVLLVNENCGIERVEQYTVGTWQI